LRITVNGKRAETTSGRNACQPIGIVPPGALRGTKEEVKSFNTYLDNLQTQVYEAHRILTESQWRDHCRSHKK
jgi:hypothetical protein